MAIKSMSAAKLRKMSPDELVKAKNEWKLNQVVSEMVMAEVLRRLQWIPVKKKLPPVVKSGQEDTCVFVWPYKKGNYEDEAPVVWPAFYGKRVTLDPNFYLYGAVLHDVTHWMPMPLPPEQK